MPRPSSSRTSSRAMTRPILGMNGNGCAGSIASGVSTGNTRSMNQASSQSARRSRTAPSVPQTTIPASPQQRQQFGPDALLVGQQRLGAQLDLRQLLGRACARRPSVKVAPALAWPISAATRTE